MIDVRDICSLSDFQRHTRAHIERLKRTRRPQVLTVNGTAALIVQDAEAYQERRGLPADAVGGGREAGSGLAPDPVIETYKAHVDRSLLRENLRRSVDQRVQGLVELQRLAREAWAAGRASGGSG